MAPITIIGSGLAGYNLAKEIRKHDDQVAIRILTADDGRNYSKPLLSTGFSKGKDDQGLAMADAGKMAETLKAEVRTFCTVSKVLPESKQIKIGEETLEYSKLVFATGAETRKLPLNAPAGKVFSVNDLGDYREFYQAIENLKQAKGQEALSIAVLGAGLVGCEYAHDLATAGHKVSVFALSDRIFPELLPEQAANRLAAELSANLGIEFMLNRGVASFSQQGDQVELGVNHQGEQQTYQADIVLSAIGLSPRVALAKDAGVAINKAIVTDKTLATNVEDIYAIGDCAEVNGHNLLYVLPLMACARALGKTLAGTKTEVQYPPMPVAVKTPSHPVVVAPQNGDGQWFLEEEAGNSVKMLYKSIDGNITGYALTGQFVSEKMALNKELPPIF